MDSRRFAVRVRCCYWLGVGLSVGVMCFHGLQTEGCQVVLWEKCEAS